MGQSTKANGKAVKDMVKVHKYGKMALTTKDTGLMIKLTVKAD